MKRKDKRKKVKDYTNIGIRITSLGSNAKIGQALSMSRQAVSQKIRGEIAFSLRDIEALALAFNKKVTWFFQGYDGWPSSKAGDTPREKARWKVTRQEREQQ